jgi:hypothetical protein
MSIGLILNAHDRPHGAPCVELQRSIGPLSLSDRASVARSPELPFSLVCMPRWGFTEPAVRPGRSIFGLAMSPIRTMLTSWARLKTDRQWRGHLTRTVMPALARTSKHHWPVRNDHCFQRIVLDTIYGEVWGDHIARPA